jgi:hypothetical protein
MGLWDILTKPRHFGSTVLSWKEPSLYRSRLRGDLWTRLAIVLGLWAAATGVLLILFGINVRPPGVMLAIGLGAVFGFGPGMLFLIMTRKLAGGTIKINAEGIERYRTYASFDFSGWSEWTEWPYDAIQRCVIVPARELEQSFSVMQICADGEWDILGIPASVELKKLAQHLTRNGVTVATAEEVKSQFTQPLSIIAAIVALPVAFVVFVSGLGVYVFKTSGAGNGRPERPIADLPPRPDFDARPSLPEIDPPRFQPVDPVPTPMNTDVPDQSGFGGANVSPPVTQTPSVGFGSGNFGPRGAPSAGRQTELLGGSGGSPFEKTSPTRQPVLGVRFRMGNWGGRQRVGSLEPLFSRGTAAAARDVILARDGYALGALEVDADEYVDAVALVFMRRAPDGNLDPSDSYTSEWIGSPTGNPTRTISGEGTQVIGICGRGAAIMDAVGLVLDETQ